MQLINSNVMVCKCARPARDSFVCRWFWGVNWTLCWRWDQLSPLLAFNISSVQKWASLAWVCASCIERAESTCPRSSRLADEFHIGHHLLRGRDPATETKEEQNDNETPAGFNTRPQEMKYEAVAAFCCLLLCHEQVQTDCLAGFGEDSEEWLWTWSDVLHWWSES